MEIRLASPDLIVVIDDQWFKEAGANGCRAATKAYVSRTEDQYAQFLMMIVPIEEVLPELRSRSMKRSGLDRLR